LYIQNMIRGNLFEDEGLSNNYFSSENYCVGWFLGTFRLFSYYYEE